jgi:spermidine synthase
MPSSYHLWSLFTQERNSGLGTGVAATGFSHHGMNNTIVEIDPAVYEAARTWFGLPDPGADRVFLEDARGWVSRARSSPEPQLYDIVVHDCFSGGGVPKHIFTAEFWNDLKDIIHPEGVLAVVSSNQFEWISSWTKGHFFPEFCRHSRVQGCQGNHSHS